MTDVKFLSATAMQIEHEQVKKAAVEITNLIADLKPSDKLIVTRYAYEPGKNLFEATIRESPSNAA